MRYGKGHKQATRARILETASARFRRDGIDGVGIADLMTEAGLTHGGFYSHFSSKEELVREAVTEAADRSKERFILKVDGGGLAAWIRFYMSVLHRDHPERGCVAAALAGELGRHPLPTKAAFTATLRQVLDSIEKHLSPRLAPEQRRQRALAIFSTMVGAIQFARASNDPALSEEILAAGLNSALTLAGIESSRSAHPESQKSKTRP